MQGFKKARILQKTKKFTQKEYFETCKSDSTKILTSTKNISKKGKSKIVKTKDDVANFLNSFDAGDSIKNKGSNNYEASSSKDN